MSLRILLVSDHYPPFIGGAHRQTQLLGKELQKRGHTVNVATVWQPGLPVQQDDHGVLVHRLKDLRTALTVQAEDKKQRHHPAYPDPITSWGLRRVIEKFQPDVIHAYGWFTYSVAAALTGKEIPLLISGRDYAYGCPTRTLVRHGQELCNGPAHNNCLACAAQLYGVPKGWAAVVGSKLGNVLLRRKVNGVHSISTYVQEMVRRDFLGTTQPDLPEVIIPSFRESVDEERYSADPAVQPYLDRLPGEPFILFVGALRRVKGVYQLLEAYQRLAHAPPLVLIGTREADSPQSYPAGVYVLPNFPHRAVMAAWEHALFGVIPSLWPEPLGSVVYEGMSRGKALIGTKPGGHTDMLIEGQTGLLVSPGDVDGLTQAMQTLIAQPDLRVQLGQAARTHAQQFTAAVSVPRFEEFYQRLLTMAGQDKQPTQTLLFTCKS